MTKEQEILILEARIHRLKNNGKNFNSGVVKKLTRKLRNLKK